MKDTFETERLLLTKLSQENAAFMRELVNTPSWIKYIGERNVKTMEDAAKYVEKLLAIPLLTYWVITLKTSHAELGIVTFIKRDYLDHYDIGFAFLPKYTCQGYAFEASKAVLNYALAELKMPAVVATTMPDNSHSISLLEKLGLRYANKITQDNKELLLYTT
jgi:ribosomal-protein-alanine N-acetyltransferase